LSKSYLSFRLPSFKNEKIPFWNCKSISKHIATVSAIASLLITHPLPSNAFGPIEIPLNILSYKEVPLCNGQKPIMPGQKAGEGLFPVCIEVEIEVNNPENEKTLSDVSVYGFVKEDGAGNSVLPNNPDFKSDSGQYAMLKSVPPGKSSTRYQFVAAVSADPKKVPLPKLTFFKTKAVSYPGGNKFKPLGECEIDPRADGCDDDGEE